MKHLRNYLIFLISKILTSIIKVRMYIFSNISNSLFCGKNVLLLSFKLRIKGKRNLIELGNNCRCRNLTILINGDDNIVKFGSGVKFSENGIVLIEGNNCLVFIGDKSTIGSANLYCGEGNTSIKIGNDCMLSTNINIDTSDFHSIIDLETNYRINKPRNVSIEDHVWIGYNSSILKGVHIRQNSIVAAKSLIVSSHDFPANSIIGGVPSKLIKSNVTWSRDKL
jgi:acetyltransferase-like isoleucine patch superfamily enzyme